MTDADNTALLQLIESETGAHVEWLGGNCPVQAEGELDGKRFYFRARGQYWRFSVAEHERDIIFSPSYRVQRDYGDEQYAAGWMPEAEAAQFIIEAIREFRSTKEL